MMASLSNMYYNSNGIATEYEESSIFWVLENSVDFRFKSGDITLQLENLCVEIRESIVRRIFGDLQAYYKILPHVSPLFTFGGIDSDIKVSKEEFERFVNEQKGNEIENKLLYFYDCCNIIETIQNSILETKYLTGQFYKLLNENSFCVFEGKTVVKNGEQFASGPIVTKITSVVNHLFINLYSQLDFITKLAYEVENLRKDFADYGVLKSKNILFGDSKKTKLNFLDNSIYVKDENINLIISLRNEIVHNASIDNLPKVFQVVKDGIIVEKFILLPDYTNGFIKTFKSRRRFFNDENKLNMILPDLISDFWLKVKATLNSINAELS